MAGNGLAYTFTDGIRAGVCVMATVGVLSALTTFLLILHLVHVAFIPTACNLRYLLSGIQATTDTRLRTTHPPLNSPRDRKDNPSIIPIIPIPASQRHMYAQGRRQAEHLKNDIMEKERMFLPVQLGLFIICLLISDFVQALGVMIQLRWLHLGGIQDGTGCWVQAALITFGDVASGVWNAIIAIHTFATVCFGKRMTAPFVLVTMICGWTIPVLMNVIGSVVLENRSKRGNYYGVAGAWCFITNAYDHERAVMHYAPMLVAAGIITLMYIPVFLTIRGNLLITPSQSDWFGYRFKFRSAPAPTESTLSGGSSSQPSHVRGVAKKMLWYPIVFMALLLPTVVCRFKGIYGSPVPLPVILGCISLLAAMGISNVFIYLFTRNLGGTPWFARPLLCRQTDVEILVERTTVNEAGSTPRGDNGRIRDSTGGFPTAFHLDAIRIPPHLGEDLYPDLGVEGKEAEAGELPSPTSKHVLLHGLIFEHGAPPSISSQNTEHEGMQAERVGVCKQA